MSPSGVQTDTSVHTDPGRVGSGLRSTSTASNHSTVVANEAPLTSRTGTTPAQLVAHFERLAADAYYDQEWRRVQTELREAYRRAFQRHRERLFGDLERLRARTHGEIDAELEAHS